MFERWQQRKNLSQSPRADKAAVLIPEWDAPPQDLLWRLPPSKSHLIRWLLLAAQAERVVRIRGVLGVGEDVLSMRRCLRQLGVHIEDQGAEEWALQGVGASGFKRPISVLNCANSGTTWRLLALLSTRLAFPLMIDGDATLRRRAESDSILIDLLQQTGAEVSHGKGAETLPYLIKGRGEATDLALDISASSQPLSALLLSMPATNDPITVHISGAPVSRQHAQLSFDLAAATGSSNRLDWEAEVLHLEPWCVECPHTVDIPGDWSLQAFPMLLSQLHGIKIDVSNQPDAADSVGHELLSSLDLKSDTGLDIDLTDANDLLPPLAAILALGPGGSLTGAAHARHKESDRITRTSELLAAFGLHCELESDGLSIEGGQAPQKPASAVETHSDHRLWMTAACLATKVSAELAGEPTYAVTDPAFLDRINTHRRVG
jgi:3-phosphoshikimate 1-carboxyvinyltransferase